jgi:hypothetical protein
VKRGPRPKQRSKGTWYVSFESRDEVSGRRSQARATETFRNEQDAKAYPRDLTDEEWAHVEPLIPMAKRGGNKRHVPGIDSSSSWNVNDDDGRPTTGCPRGRD